MKTIVIYKSKTGFTEKYAKWIAKRLEADIFEYSNLRLENLFDYDTIIYGGGLYATGINGVATIKKNLCKLSNKKIIVYATGVAPLKEDSITEVYCKNFSKEEQKIIKFFYMRGGFNYKKLPSLMKVMMTLLKWKIILKKKMKMKLIADEIGMLTVFDKLTDYTNEQYIEPIITYLNY